MSGSRIPPHRTSSWSTVELTMTIGATVSFIIWTMAEAFVTLVCIGLPILRPLLTRWFPRLWMCTRSRFKKHSDKLDSGPQPVFAMHTIGGGEMWGSVPASRGQIGGQARDGRGFLSAPALVVTRGPNARTEVSGHHCNTSDDSIFYPDFNRSAAWQKANAKMAQDDIGVEYASGKMLEC